VFYDKDMYVGMSGGKEIEVKRDVLL